MWGLMPIFAHTYICCRWQCEMRASGDCAPSGGISRLLTGKNTCQTMRREPHRSAVRNGKASYDPRCAAFSICHVERSRDVSICFPLEPEIPPLRSEVHDGESDVVRVMEMGFINEALLRDLRQPEYIHVLLNPLPVYGLLVGLSGLVIALILKSRRAQIVTLLLV